MVEDIERDVPIEGITFPLADEQTVQDLMVRIRREGLLYRVPVLPSMQALTGSRRLSALQYLGRTTVPIIEVRPEPLLYEACEIKLPPTEIARVGAVLEAHHRARIDALSSQRARHAVLARQTGAKHVPDALHLGVTVKVVARVFGISDTTYERIKHVVTAADQDPQRFKDLLGWLDSEVKGAIGRAHTELCRRRGGFAASGGPRIPAVARPLTAATARVRPSDVNVPLILRNLVDRSLPGIMQALSIVEDVTQVTPDTVPRLLESFSSASRSLRRVSRLLQEHREAHGA